MIAMQNQMVLQRRLEAVANNLANLSTSGFKADNFAFEVDVDPAAASVAKPNDIRFVRESGLIRDMSQGAIRMTGSPFDLAIEGQGFFAVQREDGSTAYTRDGAFTLSADGALSTEDGRPVLSDAGAPIVLDLRGEQASIDKDGAINVAGVEAGRVGVYTFEDPESLSKLGDNLYAPGQQAATPSAEARIVQGALEGSNVRAVVELTRMIEISRAYESAARMITNDDTLRKSAIETLGKAA